VSDFDDIRKRLEAVADIDWRTVKHARDEEHHGDWAYIGPVSMNETPDPEWIPAGAENRWSPEQIEEYRARQREEKRQEQAIIDFLTHAADDIRRLLADYAERRL
jgi:hypothetical protein